MRLQRQSSVLFVNIWFRRRRKAGVSSRRRAKRRDRPRPSGRAVQGAIPRNRMTRTSDSGAPWNFRWAPRRHTERRAGRAPRSPEQPGGAAFKRRSRRPASPDGLGKFAPAGAAMTAPGPAPPPRSRAEQQPGRHSGHQPDPRIAQRATATAIPMRTNAFDVSGLTVHQASTGPVWRDPARTTPTAHQVRPVLRRVVGHAGARPAPRQSQCTAPAARSATDGGAPIRAGPMVTADGRSRRRPARDSRPASK